ncbi:MAG: hypothetical protein H8E44_11380 [Planctomycetes bacterium]|nr:hypothetical protein [Planctomycetota bacterium]
MLELVRWIVACFVVLACASSAWSQQWTESFENGLGNAKPYHRNDARAELEIASDVRADGKQFLRATLPGKRKLEGVNVTATALSGGRLATVTAKVRGTGQIWLCLISANGWLYSPHTVPLTDQWQAIELSKVLIIRDKTLGIHFLSRDIQQGATFEVDDIQVTLADPPKVVDAQVGPWRLEAEDFTLRRSYVAQDESASGGRSVGSGQYCRLVQMPFPRTSRPVTVYLRVKAGSGDEEYRLITTQGGNTQFLGSARPKPGRHWQWVRFTAVHAGEVGV